MNVHLLARLYALGSIASVMALPAWGADVAEPLVTAKTNTSAPVLPTATPSVAQLDLSGLLGSLLLVVLCIVAVMWLLRKSRLVAGPNQAGVAVVGQIPLSMKEKLLVVQVGDEKLLIGCTSAAINTLHTWTSPPSSDTLAPQNSPFAKLLARMPSQNKPTPPRGGSGGQP